MTNSLIGGPVGLGGYETAYLRQQKALLDRYGVEARSNFVRLADIGRIHVLEAGAGDPVVILHGGAGIGAEHIPVMAHLARRFRVVVPDRPGHGLSDPFDYRRLDLREANVQFVRTLLDELSIDRAALVGNSYGGFMGVCFALAHPERVSRLVLLSFFPGMSDRTLPAIMRLMVTPVLGSLLGRTIGRPSERNTRMFFSKLIVAHIDRMPEELIALETLHSRRHRRSITGLFRAGLTPRGFRPRYVLRDRLRQLQVPATFLWSERDPFKTIEEARAVAALVPGARFVMIPDAGHLPCTDQPELTATLLERALADANAP